jgi:hypothetical protein
MYYYDNVDNENDFYYDLEKYFNDESDQKDESEEFSKYFSSYDFESEILDGICKISLPESIDDFHYQTLQEFYTQFISKQCLKIIKIDD